jgi:hypothetical protein
MSDKTNLSQTGSRPRVRATSDRVFMILLGVVGFLLLLSTIYILALS